MNNTRQNILFTLGLMTFMLTVMIGFVTCSIYSQLRTDNQTMARLRDENVTLRKDLHDTEVALDEQALKALHLEEENERLRAEKEMSKGRGKM